MGVKKISKKLTAPRRKPKAATVAQIKREYLIKKDFKEGDKLLTVREINGMWKGILCEVVATEFEGAIFRCKMINGPLHGEVIRIRAVDLEPVPK